MPNSNIMKLTVLLLLLISFSSVSAQVEKGQASFYADKFEGRITASGEKYMHSQLTAAHKSLPFGTILRVTNLKNNKSVIVRVNDRGPFVKGRIVDLSKSAAQTLDFEKQGVAKVAIEVIDRNNSAPVELPELVEPIKAESNLFFTLEVDRINPNGFGIQIGSYKELSSVLELVENLQNSYNKEVIIQSLWSDGVQTYRVIIGNFKNKDKAIDYKNKLNNSYPDSLVVDFEDL